MNDASDNTPDPFAALTDDEVRILEPDFTLKKIIGEDVDIKQVFSPENVSKAQEKIDAHKDSFLTWVKKDIEVLEESYAAAIAVLPHCDAEIKKLARTAFVIKSQAGTFGYSLATVVAKSLDDFCTRYFKPDNAHMTVIRKHIDTISNIFAHNLVGDGGKVGTELANALFKLVDKYKNQ
jgi:hypothetical protein